MDVVSETPLVRPKPIRSREEVESYLLNVSKLLDDEDSFIINTKPKANGKVNKTTKFMTERNIDESVVCSIIKTLTVQNYSYTELDRDSNFPNEYFWFFGK